MSDKPFTLDMLLEAKRKIDSLGPLPPEVRFSKYAPALGSSKPKSEAKTDDMRQMVEDLGPQLVPIAWRLSSQFGNFVVVNPVNLKTSNLKEQTND